MGDFVRGTPQSLRENYPDPLVAGIMLHRSIDRFTDDHPLFLESKKFLHPDRRRFAGIIIDIFFDHFLSLSWGKYNETSLADFIEETHTILARRAAWLTPELATVCQKMAKQNWLTSYQTISGLALTFERVKTRRDFLAPLAGAEQDLSQHYSEFEKHFHQFYPELSSFAQSENPGEAFTWE